MTLIKKVALAVVGFWTVPITIFFAVPLVVLLALVAEALNAPDVAVLMLQVPERVLEVNVDEDCEKPVGVVQDPEAVVQACAWKDWKVAVVAVVKPKV